MFKFNILLLSFAIPHILAHVVPHQEDTYNADIRGEYPVDTYISSNLHSPKLNIVHWDRECDDGLHILLTPHGDAIREPGALILNSKGQLVWWGGGYGTLYNLQVQEWKGGRYLTFWAGDDGVDGHGAGHFYIVSRSLS